MKSLRSRKRFVSVPIAQEERRCGHDFYYRTRKALVVFAIFSKSARAIRRIFNLTERSIIMLFYYTYQRQIIGKEIISFIPGEQEYKEYSFADSKDFLVSIEGEAPVQHKKLFYEELSLEQFQALVNTSDQMLRNKYIARARIDKEVGDLPDLLADVSKRLALNERLLMRLLSELLPTLAADSYVKSAYGDMIAQYIAMVDDGTIVDRVDYEDPNSLFSELTTKGKRIGNIVNEDYLSKKV